MKRRIVTGSLLILLVASLLAPFFTVYPHMALPAAVAAAFPGDVTGLALILKGNGLLPVDLMPSLAWIPFRQGLLAAGILMSIIGALLSMVERRGYSHAGALLGGAGMLASMLFSFYFSQREQSVLFSVMLTSKWYLWVPFVVSLALFISELWRLKRVAPLPVGDWGWRMISAGLCVLALLSFFLPYAETYVPAGTFAASEVDALASRTVSGFDWLVAREPLLKELGAQTGAFASPTGGGALSSLVTLSDSGGTVKNLFLIPTHNGGGRGMAVAAAALVLIGFILQLIRKVDRWIPRVC